MLEVPADARPAGTITPLRGLRALGEEAPIRAAFENGERLLVCASVRFADRTSSQPLWLTDRRFVFIRRERGKGKVLVSVPIAGCALDYENGALHPLHLSWTGPDGRPCMDAFRAQTWKDT